MTFYNNLKKMYLQMADLLSRFALMVQEGHHDKVKTIIERFPTIVSGLASVAGKKSKVLETVLHVSKSKEVTYNGKPEPTRG
jgi:hypothetical protein